MSKASEKRQLAQDLNNKLKLERTVKPELKRLFSRIIKNFRVSIAATGFAPESAKFKGDWEALLKNHYERTQKAFTGSALSSKKSFLNTWFYKQSDEEERQEAERLALIALALQQWKEENAESSAGFITDTNDKNYKEALTEARGIITEQGLPTDNRTLAATAAVILRRKFSGRVDAIAIFETQKAAERTKLTEAEVFSGMQPSILVGLTPSITVVAKKKWVTVGDNKVRAAHVVANNQVKKINEPFIVDGEMLMHPGDSSLGASIRNIANCRCSSLYQL